MGRLVEQVTVRTQITADFQRVVAPHLCRRRRYRPGAFLAIPRQRRFEADQVVIVAPDVDRRDAAGERVEVYAAYPELIRGFQPVVLADRLIVVMRAAESNFLHQRGGPYAVVRSADALRRVSARPRKWLETAVNAEGCRVLRPGVLSAIADRYEVVLSNLIGDLDVSLVRPPLSHVRLLVIDCANRRAGNIRHRDLIDQTPGDRADPICGNLIIRELRAPAAIRIACSRIVDASRRSAEIAVSERRFGHVPLRETAAVVAGPNEIAEEEQLAAFDWPAKRKARLHVLGIGRGQRRKRVA